MCAAMVVVATQDAILKWLTGGYAAMQILLVRGAALAVVSFAVVLVEGGVATLRTERLLAHAARSALNVVTITLFITALARLPLAEVIAIAMAAPLFVLALSALLLRERVGPRRWAACAVGFGGVLLMLHPSGDAFNAGGAAALGACVTYSLLVVLTRHLTATERTGAMMFYGAMGVLVVSGVLAPWQWRTPEPFDLALMLGAGVCIAFGHYCFTQGYRFAPPSVLAPFDYTALIWGLIIGYAVWGDVPDPLTLAGATVVIGSGLFILYRETRARS